MAIVKDSLKVIIISSMISLSALFVFAQTSWFEPSSAPPGGNRLAPLTLDEQGNLNIPGKLIANGDIITNNKITAKEYWVNELPFTALFDLDGDGYTPKQGDCDDGDPAIKPGGALQYDTEKDGNCNGSKEYTIEKFSNIYAPNACTNGGSFVNFALYMDGYRCLEKRLNEDGMPIYDSCSRIDTNISNLATLYNRNNKYFLCINSNWHSMMRIGTDGGGNYSCGGTGEQAEYASLNGDNLLGKPTKVYGRFWCS